MGTHNIVHYFIINAPLDTVFRAVTTPSGLDTWWTLGCRGRPEIGSLYELDFGNDLVWQAQVVQLVPLKEFALQMTRCHEDWMDTEIAFELTHEKGQAEVRFFHKGWPLSNDHFYISNYCWAMYLRILKRNLEFGEFVPYEERLLV